MLSLNDTVAKSNLKNLDKVLFQRFVLLDLSICLHVVENCEI